MSSTSTSLLPLLLLLSAAASSCFAYDTASANVTAYFDTLRSTTLWPVTGGSGLANLSSTFGPRIRVSSGNPDFHLGIDIHDENGTDIVAPLDGVYYGVRNYSDGGITVRLRHTFSPQISFKGSNRKYFYTFYMHMSSVDPAILSMTENVTPVPKGTVLGKVGMTGRAAVGPHLHFEVRIGTACSLEFQIANPASSCSVGYGYDPNMHPLLMFPPLATNQMQVQLTQTPSLTKDGIVRVTMPDNQPLLNRIVYTVLKLSLIKKTYTLDFNLREGYNATTAAALDARDLTNPYVQPNPYSHPNINTDIVIPKAWDLNYGAAFTHKMVVTDIWGRSLQVTW